MVQIGMGFIGNKILQKEQIHSRPLLIQHHLLQLKLLNGYLLHQVRNFRDVDFSREIVNFEESIFSETQHFREIDIFGWLKSFLACLWGVILCLGVGFFAYRTYIFKRFQE